MATNQSIIRKADWAITDLTSTSGLLNPEQANRFIRKLITVPTLLKQVRTVEMATPTRKINKIQFGSRILKKAVSATALSSGDRSKPTTSQIELNTDEVIAEVRLPYDVIEDNIERGNVGRQTTGNGSSTGGGIVDTILALIAERAAVDLEELAIRGDTASGDTYLAMQDGYIELIRDTGNVSDAGGATLTKQVFKDSMKAMPDQYLRNRAALRNFISQDQEIEYRDTVADRATAVGDGALQSNPPVYAFGVPLDAVSQMPEDTGIFTNPLNLLWGIQRQIHIEHDKDISARVFVIVLTARVALQVEETEAAVLITNIGS